MGPIDHFKNYMTQPASAEAIAKGKNKEGDRVVNRKRVAILVASVALTIIAVIACVMLANGSLSAAAVLGGIVSSTVGRLVWTATHKFARS